MKASLLIFLLFLSACGNVGKTSSFTPAQQLKNAENELARVGISFKNNNDLSICTSIYKKVCESRVELLNDFINKVLNQYGSEENMSVIYQQKMTSVTACVDTLNTELKTESSTNCHH